MTQQPPGDVNRNWPQKRSRLQLNPAWRRLAGGASLLALATSAVSAPSPALFIHEAPATAIYHDCWIDLNKNGVEDPYENPALDVEARITDLLGRMTLEEKTAQMATLYGFPRVLKDELSTEAWKAASWKDGVGNIDEHMNGNVGFSNNLAWPKHALPYSLHTRAMNEVQRFFIEQTRLGVPADFTN